MRLMRPYIIKQLEARIEVLTKALKELDYWFDTDEEILADLGEEDREAHMRQHARIRAALKEAT